MIDEVNKPFEKMQYLLEKLVIQSSSGVCSGDRCSQYNQLKVKQNLFFTIVMALISILIGVSTFTHFELNSFKAQIHVSELGFVGEESRLTSQVQRLNCDVVSLSAEVKDNNSQLNNIKVSIESLMGKLN